MDVGFKRCQQKLAKAFSFESVDALSKLFEHGKLVERELLISHELACRLCKDRDYLVALASFIAMIQGIMYLVHNPLSRERDGLEPDLHEVGRVARTLLVKQEVAVPESVLVVDVFARLSHPKAMRLVGGILHEIGRLVMNLDQGVSSKIGGRIIQDLMPFSLRKILAAFYTKMPAAWMLSFIAIDSPAATVLDPACGTGNLLHAACQRKLELALERTTDGSPVPPD
ncbi:hypothetical protein GF325_03760, partial [Candidatus Bathyarchaeota archaeon]|nr:hypothetical protein [Candidatus Bathyarchaeota archaeon]